MLSDLLKKLQNQLRNHEGLIALDQHRYQEKIKNATSMAGRHAGSRDA